MDEKRQFPSDKGYFRPRLVLEHHVLRRMGGRTACEMSDMGPARNHADDRKLGRRNSHSYVIFAESCVFLTQG